MGNVISTMKNKPLAKKWIFLLLFLISSNVSFAQFFNTGTDPASLKWSQLKTEDRRIIFPNFYENKARIVNGYLDFLTPHITYNLNPSIEKFNIILHTKNIQSNGLVSWAPKRMELFMPPPSSQTSIPWIKQLVAHEYRHVVQMSNLDVGLTRILRYITGEQIVGLIASIPPIWFFEGDAVLAETQFAFNGRGDQPNFSLGLRAYLNENSKIRTRDYDKWKMGSFKDYTPNFYEFGYFMTAATYRKYGDDYWNTLLRYIGRNPYLIIADYFAAKKFYRTSTTQIFKNTMTELRDFWHEESQMPNSSEIFNLPIKSYTTYKSPQYLNDTTIITQKRSFDETEHLATINTTTNNIKKLKYTPFSDTRFILKDSILYWNEIVPSLFYEHDINSAVKQAKLYTKGGKIKISRPKTIYKSDNNEFITPISDDKFALVEYDIENNPSIKIYSPDFKEIDKYPFPGNDNSITGLAYDETTSKLCYIIVDNRGATIESIDLETKKREILCGPTYIALSDISAQDGKIFFGSAESGKDEVHVLDLKNMTQHQLTSSQYGSFAGVGGKNNKALVTTYTTDGYLLAEQKFDIDTLKTVSLNKKMPEKRVIVPTVSWDVPKLDTVNFTAENTNTDFGKIKKYNKTSHLFNIHSWVPALLDVDKLIDEQQLDVGVGATVVTQNSLGSLSGFTGYGWIPKTQKSLFMADLTYSALPVHIGLGVNYGGESRTIYNYNENNDFSTLKDKNKLDVELNLSLPMNLSGGTNLRLLEPYINTSFSNSLIIDSNNSIIKNSVTKTKYGVSYTSYRAMAKKDVAPRWGYSLLAGGTTNPLRKDFGNIINLYGKAYLPGIFAHHAVGAAVAYSKQMSSTYNYIQEFMLPRGNNLYAPTDKTYSAFLNYKMPIINSDFIIPSIINIKRIYLDLFGEYAKYEYMKPQSVNLDKNVYTYGGELFFNTQVLGISTFDITLGLSLYKASQEKKPQVGFSFGLSY